MAKSSLLDTVIDTVKSAAKGEKNDQLEQLTGMKVDSVDQFMRNTRAEGPTNYGRGFLAGVIGGIVAVGVKMIVDHYAAPGVEQAEDRFADDMVNTAEGYAGIELSDEQEDAAEAILEVGMGALIGGVYGLVVEAMPNGKQDETDTLQLLDATKALAVPALALAPATIKGASDKQVESLAGNAAFGTTLEIVRRTTRYFMEQQ